MINQKKHPEKAGTFSDTFKWNAQFNLCLIHLKCQIPSRGEAAGQHHHINVTMFSPALGFSICGLKPKHLDYFTQRCMPHQGFNPRMPWVLLTEKAWILLNQFS
jgi:hypothetical protein